MTHVVVQSDKSQNEVSKLCHAVRGPHQIIHNTGRGSYSIKELNNPCIPEFKLISYNLYSLPSNMES